MPEISKTGYAVAFGFFGDGAIDGRSEREDEAIGLSFDFLDFKRRLAGPDEALDAVFLRAEGAPTAFGLAGEERAIFALGEADDPAVEAAAEGVGCALPHPFDLLEADAGDFALALVGDEELAGERTEFSAAEIFEYAGVRDAEDGVGQPDGGRFYARQAFGDVRHGFVETRNIVGAE